MGIYVAKSDSIENHRNYKMMYLMKDFYRISLIQAFIWKNVNLHM
jgi:hypothetical protein